MATSKKPTKLQLRAQVREARRLWQRVSAGDKRFEAQLASVVTQIKKMIAKNIGDANSEAQRLLREIAAGAPSLVNPSVVEQLGVQPREPELTPAPIVAAAVVTAEELDRWSKSKPFQEWAERAAEQMIEGITARSWKAYAEHSAAISAGLRQELRETAIGPAVASLRELTVAEITSIPQSVAARIMEQVNEAQVSGHGRAESFVGQIMEEGNVAEGRANMLASTMVSTAATTLIRARAEYVGADTYTWRTSKDEDVREDHRILDGKTFRWDDPPVVDQHSGFRSAPGCNANCKCWAQPNLPDPEL